MDDDDDAMLMINEVITLMVMVVMVVIGMVVIGMVMTTLAAVRMLCR